MMLIKQIPLTFTRYGEVIKDDFGFPVKSSPVLIETKGSLQPPLSYGERQKILPQGYWTKDTRFYYTKTKVKAADVDEGTQPDECTIGGKKYLVFDVSDWTTNNSMLAHYKVVLVAKEPT